MTGIFITVRLASSRLPRKAAMEIRGIKIIEYVIGRIQRAAVDAKLCICTTTLPEDYFFDDIAKRMNTAVFHGCPDNIPKRHYDCALAHGIDFIVNVDCDDVLCSPEAVSEIISAFNENPGKYDVIKTTGLPFGTNALGYSLYVLETILSVNDGMRIETGWGEMLENESVFRVLSITAPVERQDGIRLTLDYEEDFRLFKLLIEALDMDKRYVPQDELMAYIRANPHVREINSHLTERYFDNLHQKQKEEGHGIE